MAPPLLDVDQEFAMSQADFDRVCALIRQRAGINLHAGKRAMVYGRLARRLRATGLDTVSAYLALLESPQAPEWQEFVNALTTNLTAFFREEHHFVALAAELRRRSGRPLRIWCSAASTGEEPYSLAMTVVETLGPAAPVQIACSDIDTAVLAQAERGVYDADARGLSPERLRRHFLRGKGANEGRIRVRPELQRLVSFFPFNLTAGDWARLGEPFDIVFCRNVMIYFDAPTQRRVLECIHRAMVPKGVLFVGHSENFSDERTLFTLRGKTIYDRL